MVTVAIRSAALMAALAWVGAAGMAQASGAERPLPEIPALMHEVEAHAKAAEAIEKDYLYRSVVTEQESDGRGEVKKTTTREYDVFWVEGARVRRLTKKDGRTLSAEEQKKESER